MTLMAQLKKLWMQPAEDPAITGLYRHCVAQARQPGFYRDLGVPDTLDGRFDMLVLHVYLVIRRLDGDQKAKQALFDLMFADMDQNLREMGVGDMGIGRRMKAMIGAFYGRAQVYESALAAAANAELEQALARNIYGKSTAAPEALSVLADYVRRSVAALAAQDLSAGEITFVSVA